MPSLHWLTKETDLKAAANTEYRLLVEEETHSYGDLDTENIIVQGDNLEALKALLPFYAGQVKCIYIDPPYNTGSAFEHYDDNMEHTKWLSMIYPRLELLKQFLREDGVIFVNLDEIEHSYAKVIIDEIFGRDNFIGDIIWRKRKGGGNDSQFMALDHDYILTYAKNSSPDVHKKKWRISQTDEYLKRYKEIDEKGNRFYWDTVVRNGLKNPIPVTIECPDGYKLSINSQISQKTVEESLLDGNIRLIKSNKNKWTLHHRVYMPAGQVLRSIIEDVGTNKNANDEISFLFGDANEFKYAKPESLIKKLLELITNPGDLILDSFLGSGTTAAVAHKMGRRYIGVEMGEQAKTHCAARLKKVIDGEQGGISEAVNWKGGGGFRFFTLGETVFDSQRRIKTDISFENLSAHIYFTETKTPMKKPKKKSVFLGIHNDTAYALLYNGILGDKSAGGGNVLTHQTLNHIMKDIDAVSKKKGENLSYSKLVIYGEATKLANVSLEFNDIVFKQTPYDIKVW
jgi:adenine-specific DNA-methyltransferase